VKGWKGLFRAFFTSQLSLSAIKVTLFRCSILSSVFVVEVPGPLFAVNSYGQRRIFYWGSDDSFDAVREAPKCEYQNNWNHRKHSFQEQVVCNLSCITCVHLAATVCHDNPQH